MDFSSAVSHSSTLFSCVYNCQQNNKMSSTTYKVQARKNGKFIKQSVLDSLNKRKETLRLAHEKRKFIKEHGPQCPIEGRRLVDLKVMAHALKCSCGEILSLIDVEKETRCGFASEFQIKCRKCQLINFIPTSKMQSRHWDVNTETVHGM